MKPEMDEIAINGMIDAIRNIKKLVNTLYKDSPFVFGGNNPNYDENYDAEDFVEDVIEEIENLPDASVELIDGLED